MIPGHGEPRWLLPADGNFDSVFANWSPYRLSSRLQWRAIRAVSRIGALRVLPNVQTVQLSAARAIDWRALGWRCDAPPIPVVYVGTPGPRRKAVIHLVDGVSGDCRAVIKVPLASGAKQAIVREAGILAALETEGWSCAPRLLYLDLGRAISTQQFLPGSSGRRKLIPQYYDVLRSLLLRDRYTTLAEHTASWQEEFLWHHHLRNVDLNLMGSALAELSDGCALPACWVHGDFAPWNVRQRCHLAPALIDWEDGEQGGLPLQDAYHFLHMQDFLFGASATAHAADIEPFARRLGIASQQCRRLEVAYLADSYARSASRRQQARAAFLLKTLALVLRDRGASVSFAASKPQPLRLVSSRPARTAGVRGEMFSALIAQLNLAKIPYCILSGHESSSSTGQSDVDIMFRPRDRRRIPDLLAKVAGSNGFQAVQAIRHETTACYFILARQIGKCVAHLDLDCYSDYQREGRTWLLAEEVLAHRRRYKDFYLPSVADEFTYYLLKKVLKQSISPHQLKQLQHLFARKPSECRARIARFWPYGTALLLERAVMEQNHGWLQMQLPTLLSELRKSQAVARPLGRLRERLLNVARVVGRIARPTGMAVLVVGGDAAQRIRLADGLACNLASVSRRTRSLRSPATTATSLLRVGEVLASRVRSTLLMSSDGDMRGSGLLHRAAHYVASALFRPDLTISLEPKRWKAHPQSRDVVILAADNSPEQLLELASQAVLGRLAARFEKRLRLSGVARAAPCHHAPQIATQNPDLSSAGLD